MNDRQTKIYIACHKKDPYINTIPYDYYIPILCGKAIYKPENDFDKGDLPKLGDDTGDNISTKNPYYCELTATYWIWKNDNSKPDDIIGLNHYRRFFRSPSVDKKHDILMTREEMEHILFDRGFDFIIDGHDTYHENNWAKNRPINDSIYQGYKEFHNIKDLDHALEKIHELYPDLAGTIDEQIKHTAFTSFCNMLITTKKRFDEYASFLFPVLEYVESKQEDRMRVPGYVAERLMRPWIVAKGYSAEYGDEIFREERGKYLWK